MSFDSVRDPVGSKSSLIVRRDGKHESYGEYGQGSSDPRLSHNHRHGRQPSHQSERGRTRSYREHNAPPRPSFEDAISKLDEVLRSALDFYTYFNKEFEEEIHGLSSYAGSPILNELWTRKAKYADSHPNPHDREADGSGTDRTTFRTVFHDLRNGFTIVMRSSPTRNIKAPGEGAFDIAGYTRLQTKLRNAASDISKLAQTVFNVRTDADALITELELLTSYLNKCRSLWDNRQGQNNAYQEDGDFLPENAEDPDPEPGKAVKRSETYRPLTFSRKRVIYSGMIY